MAVGGCGGKTMRIYDVRARIVTEAQAGCTKRAISYQRRVTNCGCAKRESGGLLGENRERLTLFLPSP